MVGAFRLIVIAVLVFGCSGESSDAVDAAGTDAGADTDAGAPDADLTDASIDAADVDAPTDAASDAASDAAFDAPTTDAAVDAPPTDAAVDAPPDAAIDAMVVCPAGTAWTGTACEDLDECALDPCSPRATCANTNGSFTCTCRPGYTGNGLACDDIDECAGSPCAPGQLCTNVPGGHTCGDPITDECAAGTDDCSANATCTDTAQGFTCACSGGTIGDGRICQRAYGAFGVADAHACAFDGTTLRCWGDNTYGQLDTLAVPGTATPQPATNAWRQADVFSSSTCGVAGDGTWRCRGRIVAYTQLTQVGSATDWARAAAGDYHTCAIKTDRTLWCAGWNQYGELGNNNAVTMVIQTPVAVAGNDWRAVDVGINHTCAIDGSAALWCWGWNLYGQLGVGDNADRHVPTRVGTDTWLEVETGATFTCGRRSDGAVLCWGDNFEGQLGNGETTDPLTYGEYSPVPIAAAGPYLDVAVGWTHSCALATSGAIWCWGDAQYGAFRNDAFSRHLTPVLLDAGTGWAAIGVGGYVTCAQKPDGTLHCWGVDYHGQLGGGAGGARWSPTAVAPGTTWRALDSRGYHACAVRDTGSLWCWGWNGSGELGDGTRVPRDAPLRVGSDSDWIAVATALGHTCGLRAPDRLFCWGEGYGDQPVPVPGAWMAVSSSRFFDCALAPDRRLSCWTPAAGPAPAIVLDAVESMQAGHSHAVAIRADGVAWSWGQNNSGQLADGTYLARTTPAPVSGTGRYRAIAAEHSSTLAIENSSLVGAGHRYFSPVFVDAAAGDQWVSISSGNYHSCGLRADGRITCLGETPDDGGGEFTGSWSRVSAGLGDFSCALDTAGAAHCWGDSSFGGIGDDTAWRSTITPVAD